MARLNDPPVPPTESIDALKRRFIRQNRELARVNSTQSQRIRNLETEISRLLAENIDLREQGIAAAAEADRLRTTNRLGKDVVELKLRLESKLSDIHALVEELGNLPAKSTRRSSLKRRRSGFVPNLVGSPEQRDWRCKQAPGSIGEQDGQDGRLPAILEDKYYPRRTLETEELQILTAMVLVGNEDTDSPDIGPPPVAHFEDAEPIVFDRAKSPKRVSGGIISTEDETTSLSKNLETRRKRRTSSLLQDMSDLQRDADHELDGSDKMTEQPKHISKRKFEVSEMEMDLALPPQNDGFEYTKRDITSSTRSKPSRFAPRPVNRSQEALLDAEPSSPQKAVSRTALAPKSTNSPTKRAVAISNEKVDVTKSNESVKPRSNARRTGMPERIRISRVEPPYIDSQLPDVTVPPKTPAPPLENVLSPPSSAVDTLPKMKSTEAAITNSVEDVLNGSIGRGSRRAKSAISYAEPNLRDKMRRPDKKLVGAVEGLGKPASTSDRDTSREPSHTDSIDPVPNSSGMRIVKIKSEKKTDEVQSWKKLPEANTTEETASPLQDKDKSSTSRISDIRRKRTFSESEGLKSRNSTTATVASDDNFNKAVSRLSIFDHPTSSPISSNQKTDPDHQGSSEDVVQVHQQTKPSLSTTLRKSTDRSLSINTTATKSRRHSTQPPSEHIGLGKENVDDVPAKSITTTTTTASKLRRANSVQSIPSTQTQIQGLSHTTGTRIASPPTNIVSVPVQTERSLGARRRSMMV